MGKKLHIYASADVTRSVLDGVEVTTACGRAKVLTRKDIDRNKEDRSACQKCLDAVVALSRSQGIYLNKRDGWAGHLEQEARSARATFTFHAGPRVTNWNYSTDFPLAG